MYGIDIVDDVFVAIDKTSGEASVISPLSVAPVAGTAAAGDASVVDVMFDADGLTDGTYEALLCLSSTDPVNPIIEIPVTMTVTDQDPAVLDVDPTDLAFGALNVGDDATQSFTVSNVADPGAMSLELSALDLTGDAEFSVTGGDCAVGSELEPGESCTVEVTFEPVGEVASAGTLSVESADGQSQVVTLSGEGFELPDSLFQDRFEVQD